jgi:hypothetical protein
MRKYKQPDTQWDFVLVCENDQQNNFVKYTSLKEVVSDDANYKYQTVSLTCILIKMIRVILDCYVVIILAVLKCWEDQCGRDTFRFMKYSDIKINARENWLSDQTLTQITLGTGHRAKKNVQRRNTKINKRTQKKMNTEIKKMRDTGPI